MCDFFVVNIYHLKWMVAPMKALFLTKQYICLDGTQNLDCALKFEFKFI